MRDESDGREPIGRDESQPEPEREQELYYSLGEYIPCRD